MEIGSEVFLATNWEKFVSTVSWTPILHEIITSSWPIWVLADLYIMPFNGITSNNDCNLIPPVGKLGASNMFNVHCSMLDCNLSFAISGWRFEPPPSVPWHVTLLTKPRSSEGKNVCVSRKVKTPLLSQFLGYKIFN